MQPLPPINRRRQRGKHSADNNRPELAASELLQTNSNQPRSSVLLYHTGLAHPNRIELFVQNARDVLLRWGEHSERQEKLTALRGLVGKQADVIAIPMPAVLSEGDPLRRGMPATLAEHENAVFSRSSWAIIIKSDRLTFDFVTAAEQARFISTLYHELRHAEQAFRVARWWVTKVKDAGETVVQQLHAMLSLPKIIAQQAFANPLCRPIHPDQDSVSVNAEWNEATRWAEELLANSEGISVAGAVRRVLVERRVEYKARGSRRAQSDAEYEKLNATKQWLAKPRVEQDRIAFCEAEVKLKQAFTNYAALAVEQDAWFVGAEVEKQLIPGEPIHTLERELGHLSGKDSLI